VSDFSFSRLADYLRAVVALGAAEETDEAAAKRQRIARMLGLADRAEVSGAVIAPIVSAPLERSHETSVSVGGSETQSRGAALTAQAHPRRRRPVKFLMGTIPHPANERPAWLDAPEVLDPPRPAAPPPAPPEPLLPRSSARAILSTAMASDMETNQVDVDALLTAELDGRLLLRAPRRIVRSLSHGVQVLVDRGPSAGPFDLDQVQLIEQIRAVGGKEAVSLVDLDPSRQFAAIGGDDAEWSDYFDRYRPLPGVTVVLISDLGAVRVPLEQSATSDQWLRFASRIRANGNPLIAFTPFGERRWPPLLRREMAILRWDRRTNVHAVRRALRRSLR
jgi:hypothetical protein